MTGPGTSDGRRLIGGFFELDLGPGPNLWRPDSVSLAELWFGGNKRVCGFRNARSAFRHLLSQRLEGTVWLPSYLCRSMAEVAAEAGRRIAFFGLDDELSPSLRDLAAVRAGDLVLAVDYFGRPPGGELQRFAAARPDILWIEDRAQALRPAAEAWGRYLLYSPRKLVGVPDGGYVVGDGLSAAGGTADRAEMPLLTPALMRFEDTGGRHNAEWYPAYRAAEDAMMPSEAPPSRLTGELLCRLDGTVIAQRRRENYRTLAELLPERSLWGRATVDWVPHCFPALTEDAARLAGALARNGIFCPRLWPELADTASRQARHLASRVLCLPCDHRYGPSEMRRVAAAFSEHAERAPRS